MSGFGHLSIHMLAHVIAMNVAGPCIAYAWSRTAAKRSSGYALLAATLLQLLLLWGWHLPSVGAMSGGPIATWAMHLSLVAAAVLFWRTIIETCETGPWQAIAALLITGKLFCLLGVLLTFSPRPVLAGHGAASLADQQMAGLIMLITCPVAYVVAGIVVSARWLSSLDRMRLWRYPG